MFWNSPCAQLGALYTWKTKVLHLLTDLFHKEIFHTLQNKCKVSSIKICLCCKAMTLLRVCYVTVMKRLWQCYDKVIAMLQYCYDKAVAMPQEGFGSALRVGFVFFLLKTGLSRDIRVHVQAFF